MAHQLLYIGHIEAKQGFSSRFSVFNLISKGLILNAVVWHNNYYIMVTLTADKTNDYAWLFLIFQCLFTSSEQNELLICNRIKWNKEKMKSNRTFLSLTRCWDPGDFIPKLHLIRYGLWAWVNTYKVCIYPTYNCAWVLIF